MRTKQYHERTYYYFQATNPEVTEQGDEKIDLTAHNSFSKQKELLRVRAVHPSKLGLLTETKESNQARVDLHSAQVQYQQGGRGAGGQLLSTRKDFGGQGA